MYQNIIVFVVVIIAVVFFVRKMVRDVKKGGCECDDRKNAAKDKNDKKCDSCCADCPFSKMKKK